MRGAVGEVRGVIGVRVEGAAVDSPRQGHRRVVDGTLGRVRLLVLVLGLVLLLMLVGEGGFSEDGGL